MKGLTLVEQVCALAISALVLATVLAVMHTTVSGMAGGRDRERHARIAYGVFRMVRADLRGAVGSGEGHAPPVIAGETTEQDDRILLSLTTTHSPGHRTARPLAGLYTVTYLLRPAETGLHDLLRREEPYEPRWDDEQAADAAREEALARGVAKVECRLYDGEGWSDEWSSEHLPLAVELRLALPGPPEGQEHTHRAVMRPLAEPTSHPFPADRTSEEE